LFDKSCPFVGVSEELGTSMITVLSISEATKDSKLDMKIKENTYL